MLGPATSTTDPRGRSLRPYLVLLLVSFPLWYTGLVPRGGAGACSTTARWTSTPARPRPGSGARPRSSGRPTTWRSPTSRAAATSASRPSPRSSSCPSSSPSARRRRTPSSGSTCSGCSPSPAQFALLRRRGWDERSALLASLAFVFATNLYVTCVRANVWAYGQSLGFCLAVLGLLFVLENRAGRSGPGYLLLALAVGCRPLLALLFPLFLALDVRTSGRGSLAAARVAPSLGFARWPWPSPATTSPDSGAPWSSATTISTGRAACPRASGACPTCPGTRTTPSCGCRSGAANGPLSASTPRARPCG